MNKLYEEMSHDITFRYNKCEICEKPINVSIYLPHDPEFIIKCLLASVAHPFIGNSQVDEYCTLCFNTKTVSIQKLFKREYDGVSLGSFYGNQIGSSEDIKDWIRSISRIKDDESCNWSEFTRKKKEIRIEKMKVYSKWGNGEEYEIRYNF